MPYRKSPIVVGSTYHVFNRSVARQPIFTSLRSRQRALAVMEYYSYALPPIRFSQYLSLSLKQRDYLRKDMEKHGKLISLQAFCFMPNHFHFLIKEKEEHGIRTFLTKFQNSYAKYINTKTKRSGALFQAMFKAVRIENEEQLLHVLRYIHLNPLTDYELKNIDELALYPWSSYQDYIGKRVPKLVETQEILPLFSSKQSFIDFTRDQIDYQRELGAIKHLLLETDPEV